MPGTENRFDGHHKLNLGVLRKRLSGILRDHNLKRIDLAAEQGDLLPLLQGGGKASLHAVACLLEFSLGRAEHNRTKHLQQPLVGVVGEAL